MSFFTKLKKTARQGGRLFTKANRGAGTFFRKASSVAHQVGHGMDKIGHSKVGNAILDAIPEGHLIFDGARTGVGALDKGFHTASQLSKGVDKLAHSKNLNEAIKEGESLFRKGRAGYKTGKSDYEETKGKLEKVSESRKKRHKKRRGKRERR